MRGQSIGKVGGYAVGINVAFRVWLRVHAGSGKVADAPPPGPPDTGNFQYRAFGTPIYLHSLRTISDVLLTQSDSRTTELHMRISGTVSRAVTAG